jgi:hypothetical protein
MAHAFRDADAEHPLAVETVEIDLGVGRDDDPFSGTDIVVSEDILGSDRALCLHLHVDAEGCGGLCELLRRHIGVSDTGRTGSHGKQRNPPLPATAVAVAVGRGGMDGRTGHVSLLTRVRTGPVGPYGIDRFTHID